MLLIYSLYKVSRWLASSASVVRMLPLCAAKATRSSSCKRLELLARSSLEDNSLSSALKIVVLPERGRKLQLDSGCMQALAGDKSTAIEAVNSFVAFP